MNLKRRKFIFALFSLFLLLFLFYLFRKKQSKSYQFYYSNESNSNFLDDIREKFNIPALVAAYIKDGRLEFIGATGHIKQGSREVVSDDDAFHIGSCTKSMTATMLAILVEQGKLSWNTTVADIFPELKDKMHPDYYSVNLLQLLSHRGGLPDDTRPDFHIFPTLLKLKGDLREQRKKLIELVLSRKPEYKPGERMIYSNYGYVIASAMAEKVTDLSWEELMKKLLFEPLNMKTAGFGAPNRVWGHRDIFGFCIPIKPGPEADNPPVIAPAGGVRCSIKDWAKFAIFHLEGIQGKSSILSPKSFHYLHTDHYLQGYSLGWNIVERVWANEIMACSQNKFCFSCSY